VGVLDYDHLFIVKAIIEEAHHHFFIVKVIIVEACYHSLKVFCFFVDLLKAFVSISREVIPQATKHRDLQDPHGCYHETL
jgi:hypothetical protein